MKKHQLETVGVNPLNDCSVTLKLAMNDKQSHVLVS